MDAKEFNRRFKNASKDKQSFLKIYEEYYSKIVLHISVKFDDSIAHDIAHDFFCKLIKGKFEQVGSVASPTAWIYKVCDNLAINSFKKDARYVSIDDFDFAGNESAIDGLLEVKELFENLNETEKKMVYLHVFEGYSLKELACQFKIKYDNFRKSYAATLKKLKKIIINNNGGKKR